MSLSFETEYKTTRKMKTFEVYNLFDIEIEKAKGSIVWDKNGIEYLDLYGGHAVISVGHSHPYYVQKITDQLNKIGFYSNSVKINLQDQLAEKLGRLSGYEDYQLFLCNSGAEANENALKLASFENGRKKVIAFKGAFHGRTSLAVSVTDNPAIQAPINENENIVFIDLNDFETFDKQLDENTCAVIIEGMQGVGGVKSPSVEFLQFISQKCKQVGALLILDEVQSGYGRTGQFFAHQYAGIRPDIITVAKGMGNGFPIAGVLINPEIEAKKEMLGTTFGGNYLACAAGIAVLEIIENEKLVENTLSIGTDLMDRLKELDGVKEVRGQGLMIGIELFEPCAELRKRLLTEHRIFTGASSDKNTIRILPSLAITKSEIDHFLKVFSAVLEEKVPS